MNVPKCRDEDYIQFLIASQKRYTCTEAAECSPEPIAHDAFNRLLARQPQDTEALWQEAKRFVRKGRGIAVIDDSTLDKPYAHHTELVSWHWSGKHLRSVPGINLLTLLWTDGKQLIPCDCRIYNKGLDGKTKNDHLQSLLKAAQERGMSPRYVAFDNWYAGVENLKCVARCHWHFLARLNSNRLVNPEGSGNIRIDQVENIPPEGRVVHLKAFGLVRVFRIVAKNGDTEHWATNELKMSEAKRAVLANQAWGIEVYHRGLKQCCGVEKAQVRKTPSLKAHILLAIRAFLRLEYHRLKTFTSWCETSAAIVRQNIRAYMAHPTCLLPSTA